MFLYTADGFYGDMITCNEGDLEWVKKSEVYNLPIWEGDKKFFQLLEKTDRFFSLKLRYVGDELVESSVDIN
jgi:8-oxo-dGTP diphosphatase